MGAVAVVVVEEVVAEKVELAGVGVDGVMFLEESVMMVVLLLLFR